MPSSTCARPIRRGCGVRQWENRSPQRRSILPKTKKDAMWTDSDVLLVYAWAARAGAAARHGEIRSGGL